MMNEERLDKEAIEIINEELETIMTSELIYKSMKIFHVLEHDIYITEWERRMKKIGLDKTQMVSILEREKFAITQDVSNRDIPWVMRTPLGEGITLGDIPLMKHLTWSEINLLTDYARYLKVYAHEVLSEEAWEAVAEHAYRQTYAFAFKEECDTMGISFKIQGAFWYNEGSILSKYKYKYTNGPTEWREELSE